MDAQPACGQLWKTGLWITLLARGIPCLKEINLFLCTSLWTLSPMALICSLPESTTSNINSWNSKGSLIHRYPLLRPSSGCGESKRSWAVPRGERWEILSAWFEDPLWRRVNSMRTSDFRVELEQYRALVRAKDPATMEKRRRASLCPVCGEHEIDGAHRRNDAPDKP